MWRAGEVTPPLGRSNFRRNQRRTMSNEMAPANKVGTLSLGAQRKGMEVEEVIRGARLLTVR